MSCGDAHHDDRRCSVRHRHHHRHVHQLVFIVTVDEDCARYGDENGGLPNDDGAEDDAPNDDGDDGCDRTTMTNIKTRITTTMLGMSTTSVLKPMLTTMVIETMIERSPRRRRTKRRRETMTVTTEVRR